MTDIKNRDQQKGGEGKETERSRRETFHLITSQSSEHFLAYHVYHSVTLFSISEEISLGEDISTLLPSSVTTTTIKETSNQKITPNLQNENKFLS